MGSAGRAIAAPDLAVHDGAADCLFPRPVGGLDVRVVQVGEDRVLVLGEVLGKLPVPLVGEVLIEEAVETGLDATGGNREAVGADLARVAAVAQGEPREEERLDRAGKRTAPRVAASRRFSQRRSRWALHWPWVACLNLS